MWKSGSGRLGLRIFTAKGNEKNLESTAIGTTVCSRSVHSSAHVDPSQKKEASPKPVLGFWDSPFDEIYEE
ncbi:hypothetical protein M2444_004570 [Paenibacillus sp. PastF-3]|uniref:hypothetical protein n=1 Tax=Paenibacillus sp. PastF-3 TaxID=2940626 RepID=UPI0024730586|nr:hypothetical protein [Paenibacillus sp. PastF-3]MDH6372742.1 hypothetical protein [Paenibacillus sp. PastF-3]